MATAPPLPPRTRLERSLSSQTAFATHLREPTVETVAEAFAVVGLPLSTPLQPLARVGMFAFRRRAGGSAGRPRGPPPPPPRAARCAACGTFTRPLRSCPWTRSLLLCSEACHAASEAAHDASIALTFCGAAPTGGAAGRPPFAAFEACEFLEAGKATDQQWLRLAEATPQPEREGAGS